MIWVTGASGFVGGHIARGLAREGRAVIALGGRREISEEVACCSVGCVSLDLADESALKDLLERYQPSAIVHAAALADAVRCENEPALAERSNVAATKNLLKVAEEASIPIVYISTDLVFDGNETVPAGGFSENDQPQPRSVYARTKREAEKTVLAYENGFVCRVCLVYGERIGELFGFLGWMTKTLAAGEPLKLFSDEWRTPIYAPDIACAVAALATRAPHEAPLQRLFHLGGPERLSRIDFGKLLAQVAGFSESLLVPTKQAEVISVFHRPQDVSFCSKLAEEKLGITFTTPLQGLTQIFNKQRA